MPKSSHKTTKTSRRPGATGAFVAERSGASTSRTLRVTTKKGAAVFKAFVAKETPAAKKIDLIRRGVVARVVDDMVEYLDVPKNVVFGVLQTPESTAHKLIRDNRTLDPAASERVVRVADIVRMTEHAFGGRSAAIQWLKTQNLGLGGATPLSLLDTDVGAGEVRRILSSIEHGGVF